MKQFFEQADRYNAELVAVCDLCAATVSPEGGIGRCDGGVADLLPEGKLPEVPDGSHVGNWLDSIRRGRQPIADITAGYAHSVAVSMAVRAIQMGRRVRFDPARHEVVEA